MSCRTLETRKQILETFKRPWKHIPVEMNMVAKPEHITMLLQQYDTKYK